MKDKILIVDDNDVNRQMLARILQKQGYFIEEARNGIDALNQINDQAPDLVVLDVSMPGMDGFSVLGEIRKTRSQVELPVLILTVKQDSDDIVKGLKLGANDYLPKSYDFEVLFARVNSAIQISKFHSLLKQRNEVMEKELDMARLIQRKILPLGPPKIPELEIDSLYVPMDKLGGDYFDFFERKDSLDIFIADVSGHGVPGAFLASILKLSFHHLQSENLPLNEIMTKLDRTIFDNGALGMFATAFWVRINLISKKIDFCNAGHRALIIQNKKSGDIKELTTVGSPLGINYNMNQAAPFHVNSHQLISGDRIILCTDGVLEAMNENSEVYETNRWKDFLTININTPLPQMSERLLEDLIDFRGKNTFSDDLTWVIADLTG